MGVLAQEPLANTMVLVLVSDSEAAATDGISEWLGMWRCQLDPQTMLAGGWYPKISI